MPTHKFTAKRKLRKIKVLVGGTPGRLVRQKSYPMDRFRGASLKDDWSDIVTYELPIYEITVSGTDEKGAPLSHKWECFRFGIFFNDGSDPRFKSRGLFVAGLANAQKHTIHKYEPDYEIHTNESPENGAWVVKDDFLIHDGPDQPDIVSRDNLFGSIGCVEICGEKGFKAFNEFVVSISGSRKTGIDALNEIAEAGVMEVEYEATTRPPLREVVPP